jgi:transglutaminase superfamily protein
VIRQASNRLATGLILVRLLPVYVLLGLLKHLVPLTWLARWAWCPPVGPRDHAAERRLIARVLRLSRLTGLFDRDCLQRSLLLYRVLSRSGAAPMLLIGFRRTDRQILGHAWVVIDGQPVIEHASLLQFSAAFGFGVQGTFFSAQSSS